MERSVRLAPLAGHYAVVRLHPSAQAPRWLFALPFASVSRTPDELSVILPESHVARLWEETATDDAAETLAAEQGSAVAEVVPGAQFAGQGVERGFVCLKVEGTLDFALVGLLARLTGALAQAQVPVLALSTFNTDYLLVRAEHQAIATGALVAAGFDVQPETRAHGQR